MTLDDLLGGLFPAGHRVERGPHGTLSGTASLPDGRAAAVIGIVDQTPLGVDAALVLAGQVLAVVERGGETPIVVLIDTASQNMARRDELLALNEYLAHLAKSLTLAAIQGHRTVGILFGHAAAGAFIATALSTELLVALPGAEPSVMDLPSIARVTKLSLGRLKEMAKSTPIFTPGVDPLFAIGAVGEKWPADRSLAERLAAALRAPARRTDERDHLGLERKGRLQAAGIAERVAKEAIA